MSVHTIRMNEECVIEDVDYVSIRRLPAGDFELVVVCFDETESRISTSAMVKDARKYMKMYYPGVTVQRD